jgi:CheY-like chemotaxis protein
MTKILLIDDDDSVRATLKDNLEVAGYSVVSAADGIIGYQLFLEHGADLVITDYLMPRNGVTLIQNVHRLNPNTPIILITGYVERDILANDASGMSVLLPKPFSIALMLDIVASLLTLAAQRALPDQV